MQQRTIPLLVVSFFFCTCLMAMAGEDKTPTKRHYVTQQVNAQPPTIDGNINDAVWTSVPWSSEFVQRQPDDGAAPTEQTSVKILYDTHHLYVAVRAYDSAPKEIERQITRRDNFAGDWVEINLDTYFDHRTAFSFTVNAAGVRGDEAISEDGDNWDSNWNPVWYAAAKTDDEGWTAEMKIPFSQVRFGDKEEHVWGMQFTRRLFRKSERSVWQHIPQNTSGWVSNFGELRGIRGIKATRRIEVLPYTVGSARRNEATLGDPFNTGRRNQFKVGLDGKMGVTSDLTLDVTVNPDFGQVEADPSEVNLTAFESFFRERRPFFIEGQDIVNFRITDGGNPFSNDNLFYSRRIGRRPAYSLWDETYDYARQPDNTEIALAAKLTGKTKSGVSIGLLNAVTEQEFAELEYLGDRSEVLVEPRTNYFISRLRKDFNQGSTVIGGMFTATNRDLSESHLNFLPRAAYTGGFDVNHQWNDRNYYANFKMTFSSVHGSEDAIYDLQTSSRHYFQRPDADYVRLDPNRTSLGGHGGSFDIGRGGSNWIRFAVGGTWRSPGLELNDVGFMRRADASMQYTWVGIRPSKPWWIFRQIRFNLNQWSGWNFGGEREFFGGNFNGGGEFKNYWNFWMGLSRETEGLSASALRGGPNMRTTGGFNNWFNLFSDSRKPFSVGVNGGNWWGDESSSRSHNVSLNMRYRPIQSMSVNARPFWNYRLRDLQYQGTYDVADETRYVFASLEQKTLGVSLRLNYSVTPNLSIQYYAQPFLAAGEYDTFKRITDPRAENYNDRFAVYDDAQVDKDMDNFEVSIDEDGDGNSEGVFGTGFNVREFQSNLVMRWEYSPGSTVFLVWTQGRSQFSPDGRFNVRDEFDSLFRSHPDNIFLIKFNRWFSL